MSTMNNLKEFEDFTREMSHIPIYLRNVSEEEILQNPLFFHISKYPALQCIDVYKFIMQGSCGWTHMTSFGNEKHLKDYLVKELENAEEMHSFDTLFELLNEETRLGRVNLRAWKKHFGNEADLLWDLMQKAEETTPKTTKIFREKWKQLTEWVREGKITFPEGVLESVERWLNIVMEISEKYELASEIPLVSHSPMFRNYYKPSYRLAKEIDLFNETF